MSFDFLPLTGPLSTANTAELVDSILRYYYYIEVGLDEAHVAPFRQEWAANVLELVPQGPSEHVSQVRMPHRCNSWTKFPGP